MTGGERRTGGVDADGSAGLPESSQPDNGSPPGGTSGSPSIPPLLTSPLTSLLDALHEPAVRDLAWLLFSANLLQAQPPVGLIADPFETPDEVAATVRWLHALDVEPALLKQDLAAARITRVGRYAERLLGWFLQHGPAARLVAAGVPLRRAGVTLGECDFLTQTRLGARLHWELAVKCYLHAGDQRSPLPTPPSRPLAAYVGPNLKDRFDVKLAHLLNHQLPLSARDELTALGYEGPWTPQMFVKGWLFYRADGTVAEPSMSWVAPELDPAHHRGWWVTRAAWPAFAERHANAWRVLPRLEWLAPGHHDADADADAALAKDSPHFVDSRTLAAQIAQQAGPTMVAASEEDPRHPGRWIERSRGFIVPDDWPERAAAYAGL